MESCAHSGIPDSARGLETLFTIIPKKKKNKKIGSVLQALLAVARARVPSDSSLHVPVVEAVVSCFLQSYGL